MELVDELKQRWCTDLEDLLQCPVCFERPGDPVFQCQKGHHICSSCRSQLQICPMCQGEYNGTRSFLAEHLASKLDDIKSSLMQPVIPPVEKTFTTIHTQTEVETVPEIMEPGTSYSTIAKSHPRVAIIAEGFPQVKLSNEQAGQIESALEKKILNVQQGSFAPRFEDCRTKNGTISIMCTDKESKTWLVEAVRVLEPWKGARIQVVDQKDLPKSSAQISNNALVRVISALGYPEISLTPGDLDLLRELVSKEVDAVIPGDRAPRFNKMYLKSGAIVAVAADDWTVEWLTVEAPNFRLREGLKLAVQNTEVLQRYLRATVLVRGKPIAPAVVLKRIQIQNPTIRTGAWRVYSSVNQVKPQGKGWILALGIPESSMRTLKALDFTPYYLTGRVTFRMAQTSFTRAPNVTSNTTS